MSLPVESGSLGMILKGYPRISETFISNEILLLEQRGFRVRIFSMRSPRERFTHASVRRIRTRVDYLPESIIGKRLPGLIGHNLPLAARRPQSDTAAFKSPGGAGGAPAKRPRSNTSFQAGYLCHRWLRGSGCSHLHAHFAHSPTSVAYFSHLLSGLPFSFTTHAKDIYSSNPLQLTEKAASAELIATCTAFNRRHLGRIIDERRTPVYLAYHGIDLELFRAEARDAAVVPPYDILTVARMTPKKGLVTVYQALRRLKDQGIAFRHTLIGDGEQKPEIQALRTTLGLAEETRLLGTRPHEDVRRSFQKADLFVLGCEQAVNGNRDGIRPRPPTSTIRPSGPQLAPSSGRTGFCSAPTTPCSSPAVITRK